jgi:RNA polymerase sigma-70 factor (family 1)
MFGAMEEYDNEADRPSIDQIAFATIFRQHYSHLCTVAFRVVANKETAKDIVQDFFFTYWNKRATLPVIHDFRSYAFRSVRNASLNYIRQEAHLPIDVSEVDEQPDIIEEELPPRELLHKKLWGVIDQLPEQRRIIFLLSNRDGLKYKDIAAQLNISVNTVKTQIRLAYQFLRKECLWLIRGLFYLFFLIK